MSNKTRKHIWPAALVASIVVIGALAAFVVLATMPGSSSAHGGTPHDCSDLSAAAQGIHDAFADPGDPKCADDDDGGTDPDPDDTTMMGSEAVTVSGWSSSSNGGDTITITVTDGMRRDIDASFILVLEDDFVVPDSIPNGVVYFRQSAGDSGGARTYASVSIDSEDDSDDDDATYNVGDDSHTIQIYVPDMDPADATASGLGTTKYTIVIPKEAGIKNAGDSRDSKIGYQLVNSGGFVEGMTQMFGNDGSGDDKADSKVTTNPKVTLDDKNNKRGYELTISGTGFNKNSSATAYVLKGQAEPPAAAPSCATVIADGESIGSGTVGSDYKVTITTEVTGGGKGDFSPGETNYICIRDDNSPERRVSASAKAFELQHSIAVEPSDVASGEEVTVKLRDYPSGFSLESVALDGKKTWTKADPDDIETTPQDESDDDDFEVDDRDSDELTFEMPGGVSGTVEVAVTGSGASNKDATITVTPSSLDLSQSEVAPNASVIISGSGFNEGKMIAVENITIDDERLVVDDAGTVPCPATVSASQDCVQVTSSGEFTATVRVWTHESSNANPALDDDEFTIKVKDQDGFEGKAKITIKQATVKVTPETVSPRDFIVISGENWPISTPELDNSVTIEIDGRTRQADVDSTGRFRYEYQLRANIGIGDEHDVKVTYADGWTATTLKRKPPSALSRPTSASPRRLRLPVRPSPSQSAECVPTR